MTREEAIKGLKRLSYEFSGYKPNEEMFDMAIKALEQEPYDDAKYHEEHGEVIVDKAVWEDAKRALEQEPSGDLISRKALISHIENQSREWGEDYDAQQILGDIEDLPSVNPQSMMRDATPEERESVDAFIKSISKPTGIEFNEEPSGDAVSRKAVLDYIHRILNQGTGKKKSFEFIQKYVEKLPSVNSQEPKWDRLYSWLNDMRYGIAPDETVTDIDERNVRTAQVDLLDEIMEWMVEPLESEDI